MIDRARVMNWLRKFEDYPNNDLHWAEETTRLIEALEEERATMDAAVRASYEFIRRECAETNPETGEIVDAGALPTWNLVCEAYALSEYHRGGER